VTRRPIRCCSRSSRRTIANDITMRDFQYQTPQWMQGKAWDRSTPLGPALVTPDAIDPSHLDISLRLNGTELQSSNTRNLIFDIGRLIEVTSQFTELLPGDVILTGTPGGVGFRRDPQVFLRAGDEVEVEIEGLGTLRNRVEDERGGRERALRPDSAEGRSPGGRYRS
jgi:acylpyruvate hydrolase